MVRKIKCPICDKKVKFNEKEKLPPSFPFCSQRCKLVDLGKWLNDEYSVPILEKDEPADDKD